MWPPARKRHFDEGSGPARAAGQPRASKLQRVEIPRLEMRAALRHIGSAASSKGAQRWRRGREAEGDGLLNRYRGNSIVGSNPTVSARHPRKSPCGGHFIDIPLNIPIKDAYG